MVSNEIELSFSYSGISNTFSMWATLIFTGSLFFRKRPNLLPISLIYTLYLLI
ncbi:hypothetical protein GYMLUDRAFT_822092 [Collybiopsis luxurians FD-317 M1]|uniref:Uncharacterized protein n=1 Tax=Collybiopsis luxurians FD-317 M1 TaxID=944289 RepID=A0A0D0CDV5_9AGAR|nr:hypothetical protein GYMLUDRAFT_822092 [Collybiopsis luxurians FD-317 M1]